MSKTGEFLRKRRELEGISIDDIAAQTMIAKKYIEALEQGNHDIFPAEVYAKGFLRNYANALGFNAKEINELSSQYELEWQEACFAETRSDETHDENRFNETRFSSQTSMSEEKILFSAEKTNTLLYMFIFILIIGIAGFLTFYITRQKTSNYPDPAQILGEEDISMAENGIGKRLEKIKNITKQGIDKSTVIKPAANVTKKVLVEVFASEKVWLQATIDNKKTQEILLEPDQRMKWQANEKIFLTIGNAGGVVFKLNEEYIGALGRKGEVKNILVTSTGLKIMNTQEAMAKEEKPDSKLLLESGTPSSSPTIPIIEKPQPTSTVSSE
ncbi:MAG: RodZ domain-containing protein [Nitrospirota bacterium]